MPNSNNPSNSSDSEQNQVVLSGKISRVGRLRYTPSGIPVMEVVVAVKQTHLDKTNMGYFELVLSNEVAEKWAPKLKIGKQIEVTGTLWSRTFKNRQGTQIQETKILANQIGEKNGREDYTTI